MKLKVLDQVHVSSVQADTLRPGQEIVVNDTQGAELMKVHPTKFEVLADDQPEPDPEPEPELEPEPETAGEKDAPASPNKAAPKHSDKAAPKPKAHASAE